MLAKGDLSLRDEKLHAHNLTSTEKHGLSGAAQEITKAKTHPSPLED